MTTSVDVVIPVYNEEEALPESIPRLCAFLQDNLSNPWRVTIADNASIDDTRAVSESLSRDFEGVNYLYLPEKGRGRALRGGVAGQRVRYRQLHGCGPVHRPVSFPAAGGRAGIGLPCGHREPSQPGLEGNAAQLKAGVHIPQLQYAHIVDVLRGVPGRPVRLQSDDQGSCPGHHSPRAEQQLVFSIPRC